MIKRVYCGIIEEEEKRVKLFIGPSRYNVIAQMGDWFNDLHILHKRKYVPLPVLDDWTQSSESMDYWVFQYMCFDKSWTVTVLSELVEFDQKQLTT